jgi:hypothetical protein
MYFLLKRPRKKAEMLGWRLTLFCCFLSMVAQVPRSVKKAG